MTRRAFVEAGLSAVGATLVGGCGTETTGSSSVDVRLSARPGAPTIAPTLGLTKLGLGATRDGVLYVPTGYTSDRAWPLLVALHGAGGSGDSWASYPTRAEEHGMILVAPDSRGPTWDLAYFGSYGPDPLFLDGVLQHVFARCRIDPTRIALAGFSDGASYSLSLGVSNGDLFTGLIGYSPGILRPGGPTVGLPPIFISHGSSDTVIPAIVSRAEIVPALRSAGYQVTFREFAGGHEVPSEVSAEAIAWFLAGSQ